MGRDESLIAGGEGDGGVGRFVRVHLPREKTFSCREELSRVGRMKNRCCQTI